MNNDSLNDSKNGLLKDADAPGISDTRMLAMIEDDSRKLTDKLFFELLEETPSWLGTRPFLKKIAEWQCILQYSDSDIFDQREVKTAEENIAAISKALVPGERDPKTGKRKPGRNMETPPEYIRGKYNQIVKFLTDLFATPEFKEIDPTQRMKALAERYPDWKESLSIKSDHRVHRTPGEIAIHMLTHKGISQAAIHAALKKSRSK